MSRNPRPPSRLASLLSIALGMALLAGCGVKKREPQLIGGQERASSHSAALFGNHSGIFISDEARFIIGVSVSNLEANAINRVVYQINSGTQASGNPTIQLRPLSFPEYSVAVRYEMPDMPTMKIVPARIAYLTNGQVQVKMNISMDGWWRVTLEIYKEGTLVDTFTHDYNVPST